MPFTDDDLDRYRGFAKNPIANNEVHMKMDEFRALLSRLEAAEHVVESDNNPIVGNQRLYKAWRKAAGK